jgi:hypothetical protein
VIRLAFRITIDSSSAFSTSPSYVTVMFGDSDLSVSVTLCPESTAGEVGVGKAAIGKAAIGNTAGVDSASDVGDKTCD